MEHTNQIIEDMLRMYVMENQLSGGAILTSKGRIFGYQGSGAPLPPPFSLLHRSQRNIPTII